MTTIQTIADLYKMDDYLESRIADLTLLCNRQIMKMAFSSGYKLELKPAHEGSSELQLVLYKSN